MELMHEFTAARAMTLNGVEIQPGDVIDPATIPSRVLQALVNNHRVAQRLYMENGKIIDGRDLGLPTGLPSAPDRHIVAPQAPLQRPEPPAGSQPQVGQASPPAPASGTVEALAPELRRPHRATGRPRGRPRKET